MLQQQHCSDHSFINGPNFGPPASWLHSAAAVQEYAIVVACKLLHDRHDRRQGVIALQLQYCKTAET